MKINFIVSALFGGVLLSVSHLAPAFAQEAMLLPVDPVAMSVETNQGTPQISLEIADDPGERSSGLMFRETMPDDRGMLFVFEDTRPVAFWMKNTPMPLDLVFIDEAGTVVDVLPGEPFSEAPIGPAQPVRFVLELKRGTAATLGIAAGARASHPRIQEIAGTR